MKSTPVISAPCRLALDKFTSENLVIKRPGIGILPKYWYDILGKSAKSNLKAEQLLAQIFYF